MNEEEKKKFKEESLVGLKILEKEIQNKSNNLIVLDEILGCIQNNFFSDKDLINILKKRHNNINIILTGRYTPPSLIDYSDLVSEVKKIKHYFDKGHQATIGLEF